jgi:hypothetical protein
MEIEAHAPPALDQVFLQQCMPAHCSQLIGAGTSIALVRLLATDLDVGHNAVAVASHV